ncbi:DUF4259 domain-containing protein [Paraflavitalea pollutisoli]|uniref:DUF4259 domain-containing protein n=1 Tax=Paraflavitalea pollutisoli TaxID=3034143 RepID=UPI0023EC280B|nr:DUF4259 domain-containing protein [Paraflavitalea sp. H1-2-19X]
MGTWATGSFGNDGAGDWAIAMLENPTYDFLRQSLKDSIDNPDDTWTNEQSIAAAETVCILYGHIPADYEEVKHNLEPAVELLKQQVVPADIKKLAIDCVEAVEKASMLKDTWEGDPDWEAEIKALKERLLQIIA